MDTQISNSFDPVTKQKIVKGLLLALSGGVAVGLVAWLQGADAAKALLLSIVSTAVPSLANAAKEYMAGE